MLSGFRPSFEVVKEGRILCPDLSITKKGIFKVIPLILSISENEDTIIPTF
jgi:hypothetical protein